MNKMNDDKNSGDGGDLVLEQPKQEEPPKNRGGRPRKQSAEPELVLPGANTGGEPASTTTRARAPRTSSVGVSLSDVIGGMETLVNTLSALTAQVAPGGDLWRLEGKEAKAISEPLGRIIHRHGGGKAIHPDIVDGLQLAQAVGAAFFVRYMTLENSKRGGSVNVSRETIQTNQPENQQAVLQDRYDAILSQAPVGSPVSEPLEPVA